MVKNPGFYFFPGDWMKDSQLAKCSDATRGVWINLLCVIFDLDEGGEASGTIAQLARCCRTSERNLRRAIDELKSTGAAHISSSSNGVFTITSRRLKREHERRKYERDKKIRQRGSAGEAVDANQDNNGDKHGDKHRTKHRDSHARAISNPTPTNKTAADSQEQTPAAADPLDENFKDPLTRSLVLEAHCENLTTPDLAVFAQATALVRSGKLDEGFARIAAQKASHGKRNKAGLFKTLIDKYLKDQQP